MNNSFFGSSLLLGRVPNTRILTGSSVWKLGFAFLFLLFSLFCNAQSQDGGANGRLDSLQARVVQLEKQISDSKSSRKLLENSERLLIEFAKSPVVFIIKYGAISLVAIIILLFLLLWILNKVAPSWHTSLIQRWVEKYEEVNQLKANKSVLVVSDEQFSNERFIKKFFDTKDFKNVAYKTVSQAEELLSQKDHNYSLIFVNDESDIIPQEKSEKWMEENKYSVLFYFGKSGGWDFQKYGANPPEYLNRLNLANSRAQIYGNLISSLNYHQTLI